MFKIVFCTHNKNKLREFGQILAQTGLEAALLTPGDVGHDEEVEETGSTFEENALLKARSIARYGYLAVADDSGLEVDALDNAPGIYSARYSGLGDAENNAKLLRELENVPEEERGARFVCAMAAVFPDGREIVFRESCPGVITRALHGENGFGYDPLFFCPVYGKTFAEMNGEEKNAVSHRGKAVRRMAAVLAQELRT